LRFFFFAGTSRFLFSLPDFSPQALNFFPERKVLNF